MSNIIFIFGYTKTTNTMNTQEITFRSERLIETFTAKKEFYKSKIDANGGAAPWMIGRTVTSSKTVILDSRGKYVMSFGFDFKLFNKSEMYKKQVISQIEQMIMED